MENSSNDICNFSHQMVILGFPSNDALNTLLLLAKFHIYKSKMIKKRPVFSAFEYELLTYLKAERISAVSNNKLKLFDIKWKDWKKYISNLWYKVERLEEVYFYKHQITFSCHLKDFIYNVSDNIKGCISLIKCIGIIIYYAFCIERIPTWFIQSIYTNLQFWTWFFVLYFSIKVYIAMLL